MCKEEKVLVESPERCPVDFGSGQCSLNPCSMGHNAGTRPPHSGDWAGKLHFLASQVKKELI